MNVIKSALALNPDLSPTPSYVYPCPHSFKISSFPTALVIAASGASIAIIGVGLMVYFKKRKH